MWTRTLLDVDFYHIIQWFIIYSFLGWVVESIYMSFCNKKITNRGFVKGPFIPIYGIGALMAFFVLGPLVNQPVVLFFSGIILASTLELFTAHLMLFLFGEFWWDYAEKPFNYKGMLCLESSIAWGFYTIGFFYFLHNAVMGFVDNYSMPLGIMIAKGCLVLFFMDFCCSLYETKKEEIPQSIQKWKHVITSFRS